MTDIPSLEDLKCLVMFPEGTIGAQQEHELIETLYLLCRKHGFGRVPHLANAIEQIWREPEKIDAYRKMQRNHRKMMEDARRAVLP